MNKRPSPDFTRPPLAETVLGVQFDPLANLRLSHLVAFLEANGVKPGDIHEERALGQTVEPTSKDELWIGKTLRVHLGETLPLRLLATLKGPDGARLVQIENGWFVYNWQAQSGVAPYPRFKTVQPQFDVWFGRLEECLTSQDLGGLRPNLWEVGYINLIPQGELWKGVEDWHNVLPGLFSQPRRITCGSLQTVGGRWAFDLAPRKARLQVSVEHGRRESPALEELLILKLVARGRVEDGSMDAFRTGIALGHESIVHTFVELASERALKHWGYRG